MAKSKHRKKHKTKLILRKNKIKELKNRENKLRKQIIMDLINKNNLSINNTDETKEQNIVDDNDTNRLIL